MTAAEAQADHDHRCPVHPRKGSSEYCRRGFAHPVCNTIAGLAGDDPERLRLIAANLETARRRYEAQYAIYNPGHDHEAAAVGLAARLAELAEVAR